MATPERDCPVVAAWLRGAGPGAFQRAPRKIFAGLRGRQHSGVQPNDFRAIFSRVTPADEAGLREAAHHHDSEEPASRRMGLIAGIGFHLWSLRRNFARAEDR